MAQLVKQSLPTQEVGGKNILKNYCQLYWKDKNKEKEAENGPFFKKSIFFSSLANGGKQQTILFSNLEVRANKEIENRGKSGQSTIYKTFLSSYGQDNEKCIIIRYFNPDKTENKHPMCVIA